MNQRKNFLALILLDALEDEDESNVYKILEHNQVDASFVPCDRGIAPLHYACGMQNENLAYNITAKFLETGAYPSVRSNDNMTPLHVAAIYGRVEIIKILLKYGADLYAVDDDHKMAVHYAIEECYFDVVKLMRDHIFLKKYEQQKELEVQQEAQNSIAMSEQCSEKEHQQQKQQQNSLLSQTKFESTLLRADTKRISTPKTKNELAKKTDEQKTDNSSSLINKHLNNKSLSVVDLDNEKYTPNRVHYNYDVTSPYYINITHRRHKQQPVYPAVNTTSTSEIKRNVEKEEEDEILNNKNKETYMSSEEEEAEITRAVNIFSLTRQNLKELTQLSSQADRTRMSFIETWRERVRRSRARQSILKVYDEVGELIDNVMESDHLNFTNTELREKSTSNKTLAGKNGMSADTNINRARKGAANMSLGDLIQRVAQAQLVGETVKISPTSKATESSYQTVPEIPEGMRDDEKLPVLENSTNFIRSPKADEYYLQMTEAYVHTDDENGLVFYETKLLSNPGNKLAYDRQRAKITEERNKLAVVDTSVTTQSTNLTLPLDYETDALRAELTTFGEPPGPITKSTKRLYIKKLVKFKRKTQFMQERAKQAGVQEQKFSVELYRTLRSEENFKNVLGFMEYERQSTEYFASKNNTSKMREGHLKQSFIYMLIDPRISNNLPGESMYLDKFDIWKQFLKSIFYVGKGKSSRPYAHLYEAMKTHSRMHYEKMNKVSKESGDSRRALLKNMPLNAELFKSPPTFSSESKKLDRILEVWASDKGVVCLHVFHNILPIEAFTREAAIIDALSLQHLTNVKRGQYYGPAKTWTMKAKKNFGIALLYKAMLIYLAEGESQLSPSDLI